jgi:hypothetical protein
LVIELKANHHQRARAGQIARERELGAYERARGHAGHAARSLRESERSAECEAEQGSENYFNFDAVELDKKTIFLAYTCGADLAIFSQILTHIFLETSLRGSFNASRFLSAHVRFSTTFKAPTAPYTLFRSSALLRYT